MSKRVVPSDFRVFGHRGARGYEPENTIRSIEHAFKLGVRWVEVDLHAVGSDLLVIHDTRLERTTNGRGRLKDCKVEYLRSLDAGKGERIPFVEDVLECVSRLGGGVNLELKGRGTAELLASKLERRLAGGSCDPNGLLVSSFDLVELARFHELLGRVPVAPLFDARQRCMIDAAVELNAYSINTGIEVADASMVAGAHQKGFKVFVYTVNHEEDLRELLVSGIDGVFTDYPDRVFEWLRSF